MTDTRYAAKLPTADSRHCPVGQCTAVPPPAGGSNVAVMPDLSSLSRWGVYRGTSSLMKGVTLSRIGEAQPLVPLPRERGPR